MPEMQIELTMPRTPTMTLYQCVMEALESNQCSSKCLDNESERKQVARVVADCIVKYLPVRI